VERLLAIHVEALSEEAPDGSTLRDYLALLGALSILCPFTEPVRLGLYTLPIRGPGRFFGGEEAVLDVVAHTVRDVVGHEASLGIADGLFCAEIAARGRVLVAPGTTDSFRRAQPLGALGRKDLVTTCRRLGLHTVGSFADLERARVAERFNTHALVLHRVARGELGELPTQRDRKLGQRLARQRGEGERRDEQVGFFGGRGAGDDRAHEAAHRVRRRLGASAVMVASLCGGRVPEDRATLVPWGSPASSARDSAPWPGQLRAPSPATTLQHRVVVQLRDDADKAVVMGSRGFLSADPTTLLFSSQIRRDVVWYAGPWPSLEQWWGTSRRRAHLQLVLGSGEAVLLACESRHWWLVGIYD
jgi:nucleotidyltransferase/DNA polymerase involved in DNA repair